MIYRALSYLLQRGETSSLNRVQYHRLGLRVSHTAVATSAYRSVSCEVKPKRRLVMKSSFSIILPPDSKVQLMGRELGGSEIEPYAFP